MRVLRCTPSFTAGVGDIGTGAAVIAPMGITVEGQPIPRWLFHVELQREIHAEVYDVGARQLQDFAIAELAAYRHDDLDPLGREVVECVVDGGTVDELDRLVPVT